jgi:hypothetical protein
LERVTYIASGKAEDDLLSGVGQEDEMKYGFGVLLLSLYSGFVLLVNAPKLQAQSNEKEEDRLDNSALVIKEAMV